MKNSLRERVELNEMRQIQVNLVRHAFIGLTRDELIQLDAIKNKAEEDVTFVDIIKLEEYIFTIEVAKMKLHN